MAFTFEQVNTLLDKGFTPEQITALNVTAPVQDAPAGESDNTGGEQSKGGEQTSSSQATDSSPAPTPAEYYNNEGNEGNAPQPEVPFGGGELQKTFNAILTQMQETTKALNDATKANQESNARYIEQPGGSAGDTIESITASIIDPSYNMNKGGNKDGSK